MCMTSVFIVWSGSDYLIPGRVGTWCAGIAAIALGACVWKEHVVMGENV